MVIFSEIETSEVFKTSEVSTSEVYKVIANIPYYLTSAIIRHLLESKTKPSLIVLTVQREVAERLCAQPPEMSVLAVSVQVYGEPHIVGKIPAGAFYPKPDVESAIVRIDLFAAPPFASGEDTDHFFLWLKRASAKSAKIKERAGFRIEN